MARSLAAQGVLLALLAALFFGFVNVTAKRTTLHPLALAGTTYLLAGLALSPWLRGLRIGRADWGRVALMSLSGAFLAPVLLYYGLDHANAADASLLLTLEMAFTALLAALLLRERVRGRAALGMALLFLAALLVGAAGLLAPRLPGATSLLGVVLVVGATFGWSVDNLASTHLTRRHDPRGLIALKSLVGGGACALAWLATQPMEAPTARNLLEILFIGLVGVGASTVVFYRALQLVGATRTTGVFVPAIALSGAAAGALLLGERLGWPHLVAGVLMVAGVALLTTATHEPVAPGPL
jgi:drug/metabolite transporter (DMT)-like permease